MADCNPPSEVQSSWKPVQEIAINGGDLPPRFICKDGDAGLVDCSVPLTEIPVIDIDLLSSSSSAGEEELAKLRSVLSSWGCFQAINHGIQSSYLDKVRDISREFFTLPLEEKKKYSRADDDIEGYGNDMVLSENQTLDWTDRLYLLVNPEDERKLKYWPECPGTFREIMHEYTKNLRMIVENLFKAMAKSLNLEENCFLNQYGDRGRMQVRFNFYPPCPRPDLVLGLKPHSDGSAVTFLLQDKEVEGLQFLKDGKWFGVPIIPNAFLVNVGDQVEIMSNGVFKSPVHRAVTNSTTDRITIAMFFSPGNGVEVEPVEGLVNGERARLYNKVINYVDNYFQYYQHGKSPLDAVKVQFSG